MTDLIKLVYNTLKTLGTAYFEEAPQDQTFPYMTFSFPNSFTTDSVGEDAQREDYVLEVEIWANKPDATALEALVESVISALDRKHYAGQFHVSIYLVGRLQIPDPDYKRRLLRFNCKAYN